MLNNKTLTSIMQTYGITKANIKENETTFDLIIDEMTENLSLDRWNLLENVLRDLTNKKVNILTYTQAEKCLGNAYLNESKVI